MSKALSIALGACGVAAFVGGLRAMPFPLSLGVVFPLPAALWIARRAPERLARASRHRAMIAVFMLAALLRALPPLLVRNRPVSGLAINQELSEAILSGKGFSVTGPNGRRELETYVGLTYPIAQPTAFFPPGAPLWGALLGAKASLFKLANVLLGAGTCVFIYLLAVDAGATAALTAALLWAAYPAAVFSVNQYGSEGLFAFFLALLAWLLSRMQAKRAGAGSLGAAGLAAAWCSLIHPPWTTLLAALAAVWLRVRPARERLRRLGMCAAFLLLGLAPWTARNFLRFHRVIPVSTDEGIAFAVLTAMHAPAEVRDDPAWRGLRARWEAGDEAEKSALGYRVGLYYLAATLRAGPLFALRAAADGLYRAFGTDSDIIFLASANEYALSGGRTAQTSSALSDSAMSLWLTLNHSYYVGLILLACWGCRRGGARRLLDNDGARFLAVYFLIVWGLLAVIPGVDRYHFSLMIPIALLAGQGAAAGGAHVKS